MQRLNEANVKALRADGGTVAETIERYKAGELEEITVSNACARHGCH